MRNIKLLLEYDGTNYAGWQRQKNALTVQEVIEKNISKLTKEKIELIGCSRTDTGVHARGFVANFYTESTIPSEKFKDAINCSLSKDIVILNSEEMDMNFHARYYSKGKTYSYTILNRQQPTALLRNYIHYYPYSLDVEAMNIGANLIKGTHDFSSFQNKGGSVKTSVRTITQLDILRNKDKIEVFATANGFLYNMVRIIVGTLIDVGSGKISPNKITEILISKDRSKAGKSVPPQGLCLEKVYY